MSRVFRTFVHANMSLARRFERLIAYPPSSTGSIGPQEVKAMFIDGKIIANVGGRAILASLVATLASEPAHA
jgi:hypothetical protein